MTATVFNFFKRNTITKNENDVNLQKFAIKSREIMTLSELIFGRFQAFKTSVCWTLRLDFEVKTAKKPIRIKETTALQTARDYNAT